MESDMTTISISTKRSMLAAGIAALMAAALAAPALAAGPNPAQAVRMAVDTGVIQGQSAVPTAKTEALVPDGMGVRPTSANATNS